MMSGKKKREIRFRYDSEANGYDELYSDEQRTKYELALRRIAISRQDRILDCGCGTGIFLEKVAGNVQFAVGVDFSADFDFLPFPVGTFGYVFMFTVLLAPAYWGNTIRESLRVLRTHGTMTVSVPKRETSSEKLLRKLRESRLEPRELVDRQTTVDYLVIFSSS